MIGFALVLSLCDGCWTVDLFFALILLVAIFAFPIYLSVFTLLWEVTRDIRRRKGMNRDDSFFANIIHGTLTAIAIVGCLTFFPYILSSSDPFYNVFGLLHQVCCVGIIVLYIFLGIDRILHRKIGGKFQSSESFGGSWFTKEEQCDIMCILRKSNTAISKGSNNRRCVFRCIT